ncbi:MAG: hypothetical protein AAB402_01685 [Patescibacteria group bacterium]
MGRRIIFFASALVVMIGLALVIILSVTRSPRLQNAVYRVTNTAPPVTNRPTDAPANANRSPYTPDRQAIIYVARNFTERYGSGSNQNGGRNLTDAQAYATAAYGDFLGAQIAQARSAPPPKEYHGTVTRALVFNVLKQTTAAASVVVATQQTVTVGTAATVQTKDLLIDLVKVGADWKVSAAVWK